MSSRNPWQIFSPHFSSLGKDRAAVAKSRKCGRKLKGRIFSSLALILNVYTSDNHLRSGGGGDENKFSTLNSINRAYGYLRNIFDRNRDSSATEQLRRNTSTLQNSSHVSRELKLCYLNFVSKNLHDHRWTSDSSPCKSMTRMCRGQQPSILDSRLLKDRENHPPVEGDRESLSSVAHLLVRLSRLMKQRRSQSGDPLPAKPAETKPPPAKTASTSTTSTTCDRSVQCCKSTEFLKVSPDTKFLSRSSLLVNVEPTAKLDRRQKQQQQRKYRTLASPSLEYVASYRPGGAANLRSSFSTSAIFARKSDVDDEDDEDDEEGRVRSSWDIDALSTKYNFPSNSQKLRSRRRVRASTERLRETIRRTEDEILRYSRFVAADLASCDPNESDSDRILLDDYVTEVKRIVRDESGDDCSGGEILKSVKRRMDEDVVEGGSSVSAESWHSVAASSPCKSAYATARESLRSRNDEDCVLKFDGCCYRRDDEGSQRRACCCVRKALQGDGYCCRRYAELAGKRIGSNRRDEGGSSLLRRLERRCCNEKRQQVAAVTAKSSQSVDSGVASDPPRRSPVCRRWRSASSSSSSSSSSERRNSSGGEERLCQTMESAVKKFTDQLIWCERRARSRGRERSADGWTQQQQQRRQTLRPAVAATDQSSSSSNDGFNYPTNLRRYSEDERVASISTPSLVSLSD